MVQIRGSKGQMVNAEQVKFTPISEEFSEYRLSDGKILKIRVVLVEVYRLDEVDEVTGKNNYFIKSAPIVNVEDAPEK